MILNFALVFGWFSLVTLFLFSSFILSVYFWLWICFKSHFATRAICKFQGRHIFPRSSGIISIIQLRAANVAIYSLHCEIKKGTKKKLHFLLHYFTFIDGINFLHESVTVWKYSSINSKQKMAMENKVHQQMLGTLCLFWGSILTLFNFISKLFVQTHIKYMCDIWRIKTLFVCKKSHGNWYAAV